MAAPNEPSDCASVLDEFTNRVANLPAEIAFMQEEIREKDRLMEKCRLVINKADGRIQAWIRENGSHTPNPQEEKYHKAIIENFDRAEILQAEKIALALRMQKNYNKHLTELDKNIKKLQDRGEFPKEEGFPSMLNPPPVQKRAPPAAVAAQPLSQINNSASVVHARHPNQYPNRMLPTASQTQQAPGGSSTSLPATPAAAHLLHQRTREMSLGASHKRQRLAQGLGALPPNSSGLARPPVGPGTPKAGTPSSSRAGSIGPRASQKTTTTSKKIAPHRQGAAPRKSKPVKSIVSHLKRRPGTKNSPSSTNESELSDAESVSGDDDDEGGSPRMGRDGDGDEEMGDGDDDEGGDDKKYCTCQTVSYGDMVACDNQSCPYEWFHWSCVGLKSEPVGTWICPVCTRDMKR
ncbi:PHD-finger domain-containing protein [Phlyctema vagabunda]|uniref:Chromatin modification-related protein n=1 Tax=Phlyctema vagabunda TaxID=108571 RepID=A0ABR4PNE0_9HELO